MTRKIARKLAKEYIDRGDPTGWFEALYSQAAGDSSIIPWADLKVNPGLEEWITRSRIRGEGMKALKVGCGLGDDAERLAKLGFEVTAFDIAPSAVEWCKKRFPGSRVSYLVRDLFHAPQEWKGAFDFVLESYTLQVLTENLRRPAIECISRFVAPGGTLLVIARGREITDPPGEMPWPLIRDELKGFEAQGLKEVLLERYFDKEDPPVLRFRAEYTRL
ncbi:MAG: class I SAM-dependent methyltransferase [Thermodesulfobacteriota bacterium]